MVTTQVKHGTCEVNIPSVDVCVRCHTIIHVAIIVASADAALGLTVRAGLIPLLHVVSREADDAAVGHPIAASPLDVVQNGTVPSEDLVAVH